MKLYKFVCTFVLCLLPLAAAPVVYVGEDGGVVGVFGRDYQYQILPISTTPGANWYLNSFDHSAWSTGESVFSNTGGIGSVPTRTAWPANTDLFLFKTFTLSQAIPMTAKLAVDNGYSLYINGLLVSTAYAEGFTSHWEYEVNLGASNFQAGLNEIGIQVLDRGGLTALDFALVGEVPEPGTWVLLSSGLAVVVLAARRKTRRGFDLRDSA